MLVFNLGVRASRLYVLLLVLLVFNGGVVQLYTSDCVVTLSLACFQPDASVVVYSAIVVVRS